MPLLTFFAQASNDISSVDISNAAAGAVLAGLILFLLLFLVISYVLIAIMLARIFKKAGVEGWKAWVPVYNTWITLELGGQKGWWAILFLFPVINIVAMVYLYIAMYHIGLRLGKDDYFVLWAIFLPIVWYVWLAFDDSTWKKNPPVTLHTPSASAKQ